jgi:hypothetical protein
MAASVIIIIIITIIVSKFTEERYQYRVFRHSIVTVLYILQTILNVQYATFRRQS